MSRELFHGISEQSKSGKHRLEDSRVLFEGSRWRGAMYLAGYAVECLLKTKLMRKFECRNLKELDQEMKAHGWLADRSTIYSHSLFPLLKMTGGLDRLRGNAEDWQLFVIVNAWVPAWRYNPNAASSNEAEDFLDAVRSILVWIEHNV